MSSYGPPSIRLDRRGRVFMALGPLWWWIAGLVIIVAGGAVPIAVLSPTDLSRRWVAVIIAVVLICYCVLAVKAARPRWKRYLAEPTRDGLRHEQSTPLGTDR
jgi:cytochrome c oxidase assembly factor CtaG